MNAPPEEAFPRVVYADDHRLLPHGVRVQATNDALHLWVGSLLISVPRDADDARMAAAAIISGRIALAAEQHARMLNDLLEQRATRRIEDEDAAAGAIADRPPLTS